MTPLLNFLHLLTFLLSVAGKCPPDQATNLLRLKNGFSSQNLTSWRTETDCCRWFGVTCDPASGKVVGLNLTNCSLSGKIDHALFNIDSLKNLSLAFNKLDEMNISSLPFDRLTNLVDLNLSNAGKLEGQIPIGIGRLVKLVSLDLSRVYYEVVPSRALRLYDPSFGTLIRNLAGLRNLVLDGVNISSSGSEWGGAVSRFVPDIRLLSLVDCSLYGPIDNSLAGLKSLVKLRLDQNNLSSSVPEFFGNYTKLAALHLWSCELLGKFPEKIFQLPKLKYLDVSNNPNMFGSLPQFPKGSQLKSLVLSYTSFSGSLPESIGNLRSLNKLLLSSCNFTGSLPTSLSNLTELVLLDLSSNDFNGQIPQYLNWSSISQIILSDNNLTGEIPPFHSENFQRLVAFDMRDNSVVGRVPSLLFALPSLKSLLLHQNQLSGPLDELANVSSSLETVDLSENELEGPIPQSFFRLFGLIVLNLASNKFSGTLQVDQFFGMKNLTTLDLSNNRLAVVDGISNYSFVSSVPKLYTVKLISCNLTKIPSFLSNQSGIDILDLSNNKIGGVIPRWIWSIGNGTFTYLNLSCNLFESVEEPPHNLYMYSPMILDLHSNNIQGSVPLIPLNTIVLDYSSNQFSGSISHDFTKYLTYTLFLSLSNNHLYGEIPPSICNASYLQVLDLSDNHFYGVIPSCLMENAFNLGVVNLGRNQLNGSIPQNFGHPCVLQTLNLNNNQLSGSLPRSMEQCKYLEVLDIGNNMIVDSFPHWLGNLTNLRVLVLRSNRFHGSLLGLTQVISDANNSGFPMLQIFDVSANNFTGNLPPDSFKNLKAMILSSDGHKGSLGYEYLQFTSSSYYQNTVTVTLKGQAMTLVKILTLFSSVDFSSNNFGGNIPDVIGELNSLVVLNLSHNKLTGQIPSQLGKISELESLDLSSNMLSGNIPLELAHLNFLELLNLSYNNLVGKIPWGPQFSTFANDSFLGNAGLCGLPLTKQCSVKSSADSYPNYCSSVIALNWQFIYIGLGFGVGLAVVVALLLVWSPGKKWHDRHVDRFLIYIMTPLFSRICWDGKVGDKSSDSSSIELQDDGKTFCIFCTKLDFHKGRVVIHHVDCSCPRFQEEPLELDLYKECIYTYE